MGVLLKLSISNLSLLPQLLILICRVDLFEVISLFCLLLFFFLNELSYDYTVAKLGAQLDFTLIISRDFSGPTLVCLDAGISLRLVVYFV